MIYKKKKKKRLPPHTLKKNPNTATMESEDPSIDSKEMLKFKPLFSNLEDIWV